jgi:hypothetical protein
MRLFNKADSYATPEDAEKKLRKVAGDEIERMHWVIAVNEEGRFVPVVTDWRNRNHHKAALAHQGVCIVG